jgi:uncharacterized protein YbjT (DUF2867 family)
MTRFSGKLSGLPEGTEGVVGDLQKPETLPPAMVDIDAVFLATALVPDEINQGLAAVEAAKAAGIGCLVYMSVHKVESAIHIPHFATKIPIEHAVRTSGIPFTIVRPNNFYQNDFWFRDAIKDWGVYPQPMSDKGISRVDVRDIAEAVALSITTNGHAGRTYSLVGPEPLTGEQTAAIYSRHLGRPVRYAGRDVNAFAAEAAKSMPAWLVLDLRIMYAHFAEHGLVATPEEVAGLTALLGHPPRDFESFVRDAFPAN